MKRFVVFIVTIMLISLAGWHRQEAQGQNAFLLDVMNNEKSFIAENGAETLFRDFKIPGVLENIPIVAETYTFVDLDRDGDDELAVKCTTDYGLYIILRYDENTQEAYGYSLGSRSFIDVKTDGTFMQSSGADINAISKMSFDQTKKEITEIAVQNGVDGIFELNHRAVTESEIEDYFDHWVKKDSSKWVTVD